MLTRERVEPTPRKAMHKSRRARILAKHDNRCAYPGCEVSTGLEIDHVICVEIGGADEDHNLEPLCRDHHRAKTARDLKLIAKARRIRKRLDGERAPRKPIPGRPLQSRPFPKRRT